MTTQGSESEAEQDRKADNSQFPMEEDKESQSDGSSST